MTIHQVQTTKTAIAAKTIDEARVIVEMFPDIYTPADRWIEHWDMHRELTLYCPSDSSIGFERHYKDCEIISLSDITDVSGEVSGDDIPTEPPYERCEQYGDAGGYQRLQGFRAAVTVSRGDDTLFVDDPEHQAFIEIQQVNEVITIGHDIAVDFASAILDRMKPEHVDTVISQYLALTTAPKVEMDWDKVEEILSHLAFDRINISTTLELIQQHLRPSDKLDGVDWAAKGYQDAAIEDAENHTPAPALQELGEEDWEVCPTCQSVVPKGSF